MLLCPRMSATVFRGTPAMTIQDAKVCRRSWNRKSEIPAALHAALNAHRGIARRREIFLAVPPENEPPDPPRPDSAWHVARRKSWARLIRRVYEVDPLLCPCGKRMRVVGFIA